MANTTAARYIDTVEVYLETELDFQPNPNGLWLEALGGRFRFAWEDAEAGALAVFVMDSRGLMVDSMRLSGLRRPMSTVTLVAAFIEAHDR